MQCPPHSSLVTKYVMSMRLTETLRDYLLFLPRRVIHPVFKHTPFVICNLSRCHHHAALQIGEYAELGNVTRELVENQEVEFTNEVKSRAEANGGKIKYVDCVKAEHEVEASEIMSQKDVIKGLQSKYSGFEFPKFIMIIYTSLFLSVRVEVCPFARV